MRLSEEQRFEAWAEHMREMSRRGIETSMLKSELRGALDSLDEYADANAQVIDQERKGKAYIGHNLAMAADVAKEVTRGRLTILKAAFPAGRGKITNPEIELMMAHVLQARDRVFREAEEPGEPPKGEVIKG